MTCTHYTRGNGQQRLIADMPLHLLEPALAKLKRERIDDSRDAEIAAMDARVAEIIRETEAEEGE